VPFVVDKALHCSSCLQSLRDSDRDTPSIRPRLWRTSRSSRHRRPLRSPTRVVLDAEEMGEEVVRRLITSSIRLLINILVLFLVRARAIGKEPTPCVLEILRALACLPSYISLYIS